MSIIIIYLRRMIDSTNYMKIRVYMNMSGNSIRIVYGFFFHFVGPGLFDSKPQSI